jgi:hypothetical protein
VAVVVVVCGALVVESPTKHTDKKSAASVCCRCHTSTSQKLKQQSNACDRLKKRKTQPMKQCAHKVCVYVCA